jgi:uncharacterized protein YndB with AHSA1/START domain
MITDPGTVQFVRHLPVPIERVWDYVTKREYLSTWLGVGDIGPGEGPFELTIEGPDLPHSTGARIVGTVTRWNPPGGLSFTWNHLAPGLTAPTIEESLVEIDLTPTSAGVTLTLRHSRIDSAFTSRLGTGWHAFLDALACRIDTRKIVRAPAVFPALLPVYEEQAAAVAAGKR